MFTSNGAASFHGSTTFKLMCRFYRRLHLIIQKWFTKSWFLWITALCSSSVCLLSVSDSGSSQGLSQPSTQTTQYLRADTPNNVAPVTSKRSHSPSHRNTQRQPSNEMQHQFTFQVAHIFAVTITRPRWHPEGLKHIQADSASSHACPNATIDCEWPS